MRRSAREAVECREYRSAAEGTDARRTLEDDGPGGNADDDDAESQFEAARSPAPYSEPGLRLDAKLL